MTDQTNFGLPPNVYIDPTVSVTFEEEIDSLKATVESLNATIETLTKSLIRDESDLAAVRMAIAVSGKIRPETVASLDGLFADQGTKLKTIETIRSDVEHMTRRERILEATEAQLRVAAAFEAKAKAAAAYAEAIKALNTLAATLPSLPPDRQAEAVARVPQLQADVAAKAATLESLEKGSGVPPAGQLPPKA